MQWEEVEAAGAGPKMLYPMAWSLLPLTVGFILLIRTGGLLPSFFLAAGIMLSMVAVWLGANFVPGRIDMMKLLISPFAAFSLFFQPPELIQAVIALVVWIVNYRTAAFLSAISVKAFRLDWDPDERLPDIEGAIYFQKKWASRPLFRLGKNMVRGVRIDGQVMLEADAPITFNFSKGS